MIPVLVISQIGLTNNEYPKLYINGEDTLLLITVEQVKFLNIEHIQKEKYKTLTDSLNKQIEDYELVIIDDMELINNLIDQLGLKDNIISEQKGIQKELIQKNKKTEKKLKRNVYFNKILIILSVVLGIILIK